MQEQREVELVEEEESKRSEWTVSEVKRGTGVREVSDDV